MEEKRETLEERQIALQRAKQNQETVRRRKRINRYKNIIVGILCLISVAPAVFSVFLLYQVTDMEQQVSYLAGQKDAADSVKMSQTRETAGDDVTASGDKEDSIQQMQDGRRVYLTFDDGPSKQTDEILEILERNQVKATFFVIGHTDSQSMEEYKKIVEQGHGIGIHSYTHEYDKIYSSLEAFQQDVTSMSDLIYAATGVRTHLYRFPGGSANSVCNTSMEELIRWLGNEGYIYYDWNALNGDAVTKNLSVDTLIRNVMKNVELNRKNNQTSIVLMHDLEARHNTVEALEPLIQRLKAEGYVMDEPITEDVEPIQQKKLK